MQINLHHLAVASGLSSSASQEYRQGRIRAPHLMTALVPRFGNDIAKKCGRAAALKQSCMAPHRCRWTLPPEPKVQDGRFPDASGASR